MYASDHTLASYRKPLDTGVSINEFWAGFLPGFFGALQSSIYDSITEWIWNASDGY